MGARWWRGRQLGVWLRSIVRILWSHRGALLVVAVVDIGAFASGYARAVSEGFAGVALLAGEGASRPDQLPRWVPPAAASALAVLSSHTVVGYLAWNTLHCLSVFLWGLIPSGAVSLLSVASGAHWSGRAVGSATLVARQAAGSGPAGAAAGVLLPHAVPEQLAVLVAAALGLAAGWSWVRPRCGFGRWESLRRVVREFIHFLPLLVALLGLAAVLEVYVQPRFADRYLIGIRPGRGGVAEERVGPKFSVSRSVLSPDGRAMAWIDVSGSRVLLTPLRRGAGTVALMEAGADRRFADLFWAPDGERIGVVVRSGADDGGEVPGLWAVDMRTRRTETFAPPPGSCLYGAWSPDGQSIAAAVVTPDPSGDGRRRIDVWVVQTETGRWQRLTDFQPGSGVVRGCGLSWGPDGKEVAFVRRASERAARSDDTGGASDLVLCAVSVGDRRVREIARISSQTSIAWSPDGGYIALVEAKPLVGVPLSKAVEEMQNPVAGEMSVIRGNGAWRLTGLARADVTSSLSWSPDGKQLLYQRLGTPIRGTLEQELRRGRG